VISRKSAVTPLLGAAAALMALFAAPTAAADVSGSDAPTYVPTYDPYPCAVVDTDPLCAYYDPYDPGAVFDQQNWGLGAYGGVGVGMR